MTSIHTLKNGARVLLAPFAGTDAATALILFHVGSRNEDLAVWGGSHFIEHLMFKGTEKRPATADISRELDQYGAEYNAYTGKDVTGYWVKIAAPQLPVAVDLLHDMLFQSVFAAKEMTREKQVIIEEIKMYEENPIMHLEDLLEEAMFDGHTLGRNIAGTPKSMTDMDRKNVLRYRDAYYVPENMVIVLAGKVDEKILKLLEKSFGKVQPRTKAGTHDAYKEAEQIKYPRIRRQEKDIKQLQMAIGFPIPGRGHKDTEALKLMSLILGGTMSSRLFIEVRERRGLCYSVRAGLDQYEDVGALTIRAGLDVARLPLAAETIMKEVKKIVTKGVTPAELKMAKEHMRGTLTLRLEDSSERAEFFGKQLLYTGEVFTPAERLKKYDKVTTADIQRVAKEYLQKKKMSLAAIGPQKKDEDILKHFV